MGSTQSIPVPQSITHDELREKLRHCEARLARDRKKGILLVAEGALRWLTGMRQQVADIAPDADSPVHALLKVVPGGFDFTFIAAHTEIPRLKDRIPEVFGKETDIALHFAEEPPQIDRAIAVPRQRDYPRILGDIVRPIVGGFEGNQVAKLKWLSAAATAALVESAHQIRAGMNGVDVRNIVVQNAGRGGIESNLVLVALKGQEGHFHPLYEERYTATDECWVKLVCGARYAELIVSSTVMVKLGKPPAEEERLRYRALQEATLEYADCYRDGVSDARLYAEVYQRFKTVGEKYGIPDLADSAYAHHLGGPTSPLGNRDYLIMKDGRNLAFPWMQFAVNPVELKTCTKAEVQGIVMPGAAPFILDNSVFTPQGSARFTELVTRGGTKGRVIDIIEI